MAKIVKRNTMNNELQINKHKNNGKQLCVERVLNGTASLKDLLSVETKSIDFAKCLRKINTIQKIYSAGSQVGACTVVAGNMVTVKLNEDSITTYKKALKMLKKQDNHTPYGDSIWVEGYNMFSEFNFENGMRYCYYVVTNEEIAKLEAKITGMDYDQVTLEDLQALQSDLPPFVRAWQESSIDVSKDKDKVFNKAFSDFFGKIEVTSTYLKNNSDLFIFNLNDAKMRHKAGRVNDIRFEITLPQGTDVMPDMLGDINYTIKDAAENYFNGDLLELYKMSNRSFYEQFADECMEYPELALFIQQVFTLSTQAYNENTKLTKEQYAVLRNAVYSKAQDCGITDMTQVVKIAISVAMRHVKEREDKTIDVGTANIDNYKDSKVINLFPSEYVHVRTGVKETKELTLLYVDRNTQIIEGQTIEFIAGFSMDDTVEVEELYTGTAYNKAGKLVYDVDPYAFEYVSSIITVNTFAKDATTADMNMDEGQFATEFFNTNDTVIIAGKNRNVLLAKDGKTLVAKVVTSPELMPTGKARVYTVKDYICFEPNAGRNKVFFVVLSK